MCHECTQEGLTENPEKVSRPREEADDREDFDLRKMNVAKYKNHKKSIET